jgi:hypothetical protein
MPSGDCRQLERDACNARTVSIEQLNCAPSPSRLKAARLINHCKRTRGP